MPHSVESKKKMIINVNTRFYADVQRTFAINKRKHTMFFQLLHKFKGSSESEADIVKKVKDFFKQHPTLKNQISGYHPERGLILRATESKISPAPVNPPGSFTKDALLSILEFMPFPVMGRLAMTCKWMNANITTEHVESAMAKTRALFSKVTIYAEPSSGRQMTRVYNTEWDSVDVGILNPSSSIYVLKSKGRMFVGFCIEYCNAHSTVRKMTHVLTEASKDGYSLWFRYYRFAQQSDDKITIDFILINGNNMLHDSCTMTFEAFVQ